MPSRNSAPRSPSVCNVAIVDDHDFTRAGITAILKRSRKCHVCGSGSGEREAIQIVESQRPDVLILDLLLGYRDGISLVKDLVARYPQTKILAMSEYSHLSYAERAMKAGAQGFLTKSATAEDLLAAVDSIHHGRSYLTRRYAVLITGKPVPRGLPRADAVDRLTDRELHVFQLTGVGVGTGEIAKQLGLSRKTIESYHENIKHKLGCTSAVALKERAQAWIAQVEEHPPEPLPTAERQKPGIFPDIQRSADITF